MTKIISIETKQKILNEVRRGERTIVVIAKEYGIRPGRIYNWIHRGISKDSDIMEVRKLQRKNKELYEIIGRLTEAVEKFKKK